MITKKILLLLFIMVCSTVSIAQNKQKDTPPDPEVGTLDAEWKPIAMNHYIGLRAGYGMGQGRFEPKREQSAYKGLKNYGIFYRFDAPIQKYVGCIEVDVNYTEKGYVYESRDVAGDMFSRKYSIIDIPILWQPYLPLSSKNSASRLFLNAGPYLGYALSSEYRNYKSEGDVTIEEGSYKYYKARDNYVEYGIVAGAGFQVAAKRLTFGLDFRYNIMLSDIMKTASKYPGNFYRSPVDQLNVSFSVGFKLTRKGDFGNPTSNSMEVVRK